MNTPSTIIKSLIVPLVIKFSKGDLTALPDAFWNQFATDFIYYENDATPIYASLYKLELQNPEAIFEKLPQTYSAFIKELAEEYVLGYQSEITTKLLESKNETFLKEVTFLKTMKAVITKTERNQLKKDLPIAYDRLVFELDEETLKQVSKKKSREDLRAKFEQWDEEMVVSEPILIETNYSPLIEEPIEYKIQRTESKVISLSWIKYAAAACIVLTAGIMYFKFNTDTNLVQPGDTNVVTAPVKKDTITPEITAEALAEVSTATKNATVIESGMGVASNTIKITENNQKARMLSIVTAIEKYRQLLEKEFSENKVGVNSRVKELETKKNSLEKELALLKEREKQYVFDGKALVLYVSNTAKENTIVLYEETYYLKKDADYFKLTIATAPQLYKKISDTNLINNLDDILSENGK
jgi:ribosomal protein S17E